MIHQHQHHNTNKDHQQHSNILSQHCHTTNHSTAFHPHHFNFSQRHLLLLKLPRTSAHHLPPLPQNRCHKSSCSFSPIFHAYSMLHHNCSSHLIQHKASFSRSPHHSIILLNHKSTWSTNTHSTAHQHQHQQTSFKQHQGDPCDLFCCWLSHDSTTKIMIWLLSNDHDHDQKPPLHKQHQQHSPNYMNLWCHTPYPDTPPPSTTPKTNNIQTSGHYCKCESSPPTHTHSTCPTTQNQTKQVRVRSNKACKRISHSFLLYPVWSSLHWQHDNWNFPVSLSLCTGFAGSRI